ncbi:MAG: radical SAM protein [Treponema sp.]|nr:radical SAM protein [Treponema sp.]
MSKATRCGAAARGATASHDSRTVQGAHIQHNASAQHDFRTQHRAYDARVYYERCTQCPRRCGAQRAAKDTRAAQSTQSETSETHTLPNATTSAQHHASAALEAPATAPPFGTTAAQQTPPAATAAITCSQHVPRRAASTSRRAAGFCGESDEIRIASAGLHFGEEPLVTARGGSGTIFFTGCTLRCAFCQNYQISQNGMGAVVPQEEFVAICVRLQEAGAENINLVTGSHHIPRIAAAVRAAQNAGVSIPFCWNSSAYESVEMLELLKDIVSIWLPDLKTLSSALSATLFGARDYPQTATRAISWMIEHFPLKISSSAARENTCPKRDTTKTQQHAPESNTSHEKIERGVIVRHLFLPGHFAETCDTLQWLKQHADGRAIVSLMSQYTPVPFREKNAPNKKRLHALSAIENRPVNKTEDRDLRDLIDAYDFSYLFYQELSDDTSWLPDFTQTAPFPNALSKPLWHWSTAV